MRTSVRNRSGLRALAAAAVLSLALAGCGSSSSPTPSGEGGTPASGSETSGGTFTYAYNSQVVTELDPAASYSNEIVAMNNMYEGLTRYDSETEKVEPQLAESWKSEDGAKRWTFKLRPGVKFHTGRPVDAAAVKAAIERTIRLGQGAAPGLWGSVDKISAPDEQTVVFDLKFPAALDLIASAGYAAFVYDTKAASGNLREWFNEGNEAGTGPYQLESWNKGQEVEMRLKAFEDYWGGWDGAHYDSVVYRVVSVGSTAAQLIRSGEVDFVNQLSPQLWQSLKSAQGVKTTSRPGLKNILGLLNTTSGPLANADVRRAISHAVDYEGIVAANKGGIEVASGVIPPSLWAHSDELPVYKTDPEKAKELLAKAGYGPGKKPVKLTLTHTTGDQLQQTIATLMKSALAPLNVQLEVKALQWPTQWARGKSKDESKRQDIFLFYWWPDYADPNSWFSNMFKSEDTPSFNMSYYSNPKLDKQIQDVQALTATDRPAAIEMYKDMQTTLLDEAPALFLGDIVLQRAIRSTVGGYVDNPAYPEVVFVYDLKPGGS